MIYFLLFIYVLAFGWWIKSSAAFAIEGLSRPFISFIFVSKVIVGLLYGAIHLSYFNGGDTFLYLQESTLIGSTFFSYPEYYIGSLLGWEVALPTAEVFTYPESSIFWKNLGSYILVHLHGFLHLFTFGYYELHIFFIAIIGLFASLNFYKIFSKILNLPKSVLIICCFFLPSLTFWTAGLHKDVYVYFGLSLFLMALLEFQNEHKSSKTAFKLIAAILIIGLARHYLLVLLLPATIAYLITLRKPKRVWTTYLTVYSAAAFLAIFFSKFILNIEIFELLANQQAAFLAEVGSSSIQNVEPFEPTIWGVLGMTPMAVINVLGRPFLWECRDFLQVLASIEILCFLGLMVFAFVVRKQSIESPNVLIHFILAYAISNILLVGLLVSNIGTIVRYRAIALGILSALLTHILDFYHIGFRKKTPIKQTQPTITPTPTQKQVPAPRSNKKASILQ